MVCASCGHANSEGAKFCEECGFSFAAQQAGAKEQRKTVTVLFCDLSGSTVLGETLDPERLRALLARYFERMKAIIERHGGSVEKFIGDAVMAGFGVPAVHGDDGCRAVRAAGRDARRVSRSRRSGNRNATAEDKDDLPADLSRDAAIASTFLTTLSPSCTRCTALMQRDPRQRPSRDRQQNDSRAARAPVDMRRAAPPLMKRLCNVTRATTRRTTETNSPGLKAETDAGWKRRVSRAVFSFPERNARTA